MGNGVRRIMETAVSFLFPPVCVCCGAGIKPEHAPLCQSCLEKWETGKSEYRGSEPPALPEGITKAYHLAFYTPSRAGVKTAADSMAYAMKQGKNRFVYPFIARQLCSALYMSAVDGRREPDESDLSQLSGRFDLISWLPRSRKNAAKYGVDQSRRLTSEISSLTGIKAESLFVNRSSKTQHELSSEERKANASGLSLIPGKEEKIAGRRLILVDDIVTTGSTVSAAAALALEAGVGSVTLLAPFKTGKSGACASENNGRIL